MGEKLITVDSARAARHRSLARWEETV